MASKLAKKCPCTSAQRGRKTEHGGCRGCFRGVLVASHGGGVMLVLGVLASGGGWPGNGWNVAEEVARKFAQQRKLQCQVDHGGRFERVFEALSGLVETKHELNFIYDIASFQFTQKSSNLIMFWLPNKPPKSHNRINFENNLIWVEFVNSSWLLCFICDKCIQ